MKLVLTQVFKKFNGNDMKMKEGGSLSLQTILVDTLLGQVAGDEDPAASQYKVQRFELGLKISKAEGEAELSLDELGQIKRAIEGKQPGFLPLMHAQALAMIEDKPTGLESE